jgi:curved DNA-binding protein CbpA
LAQGDPARTLRNVTDLYETLQVASAAEPEVIRAAFRALARKYHPDAGGSLAAMKAINDAWAILSDPARRAAYDATGRSGSGVGNRRKSDRRQRSDRRSAAPSTGRSPGRDNSRRYTTAEGGLDFGRYAGWTIPDLAKHDPDYLEWLRRTPIGRPFSAQIEQVLASRANVTTAPPPPRRGWRTHR